MGAKIKLTEIPIVDTNELVKELIGKNGMIDHPISYKAHDYFHINRLQDYFKVVDSPPASERLPRRVTVFSFFFITAGMSRRSNGIDTYDFGENTFLFTPAHQIATNQFVRDDVEGYYCHFNIELVTQKYNLQELTSEFPFLGLNAYPIVKINPSILAFVLQLLERLFAEYKQDDKCNDDILRTYLLTLFTELKPFVDISKPKNQNAASLITEEFKKAMNSHILSKNKITDYAELLNISPNHLNKCVKQTTGKSAHDLLNEMLLLEAKVLLKQTNLNIKEIAYKIGKNEVSDFARFFKAKTGMRPSEYREYS